MKIFLATLFPIIMFISSLFTNEKISRMNVESLPSKVVNVQSITLAINDTIPNKTLKVYNDKNGFPIKYSRNIVTGVCIDGECRLVAINLFWTSTGRYLGFELPDGEFLSKTEHNPFTAFEYDRLHYLLSEVYSPLANYSMKELVPNKSSTSLEIDAFSSATISAVLDHIVEGAVYTTYSLWHIVHGPTQNEIKKLTTEKLNTELVLQLLNSTNIHDQIWTLNNLPKSLTVTPLLREKLLYLISGTDIYLAERAINAIDPQLLTPDIQTEFARIFVTSGFLQKRLILDKLTVCNNISTNAVLLLTYELPNLNGSIVKKLLELYTKHGIYDAYTTKEVAKLLKNKNNYIATQAYKYLKQQTNLDKKTSKQLLRYQKQNT